MKGHLIVLVIVSMSIFGDYLLKLASQKDQWVTSPQFLGGAVLYGFTAFGWVYAMKYLTLGAIGVSYSILSILTLTALGVLVFKETLGAREILGIALAFVSLGLMSRFS